jgi:hypothetical protein
MVFLYWIYLYLTLWKTASNVDFSLLPRWWWNLGSCGILCSKQLPHNAAPYPRRAQISSSNISCFGKYITILQGVMTHQCFLVKACLREVFVLYLQIRYMPKNGTSEVIFHCTKAYHRHHKWSHILRCWDPLYFTNSHLTCWKHELMFLYMLIHRWYFMVECLRKSLPPISYIHSFIHIPWTLSRLQNLWIQK